MHILIVFFLIDARTTFPLYLYKKERERRSRAFPSDSNPDYNNLTLLSINAKLIIHKAVCRLYMFEASSFRRLEVNEFAHTKAQTSKLSNSGHAW